jgi:hypothetical protein
MLILNRKVLNLRFNRQKISWLFEVRVERVDKEGKRNLFDCKRGGTTVQLMEGGISHSLVS